MTIFDKKVKNNLVKKYKAIRDIIANTIIYFVYYHIPINENLIYVESQSGKALNGNMLRICEELSKPEYKNFKVVVRAVPDYKENIRKLVKNYNLSNVHIVSQTILSLIYLERAKYIFYDAGVQSRYVKREGQIFTNTWHGTPFKVMGKSILAERHSIGNLQRNFLMSDYLLFPNKYTQNIFMKDYMLENIWTGKALLSGYPRNSVFFDNKKRAELRRKLGLTDKQVFAYLPTHRGTLFHLKNNEQKERVIEYLEQIDEYLKDNQVLILKLHLYNNQDIDCSKYKHVINFPKGYETYDVLNIIDCLITDYSSVFFDFANTHKKIILFAYDEEEYFADRGVYFPFADLPFPKVKDVKSLIRELNSAINYDDTEFIKQFCPYDNKNSAADLCRHIIKGNNACIEEASPSNGKENVLIYAGNLAKNGITSSVLNLLKTIDLSKRNYFLTFTRSSVRTPEKTLIIPDNVPYVPIAADPCFTLFEKLAYKKLLKSNAKRYNLDRYLHRMYVREIKKQFWHVKFDHVIQFDGYSKHPMLMFTEFDARTSIWVHNDMLKEISLRRNQSRAMLNYCYNIYNDVAVVSEGIVGATMQISDRIDNIRIVHNCFDNEGILEKSRDDISFDKDTECITANPGGIKAVLELTDKKIITIGRFSPEKGHRRLLDAFEKYWLKNKNYQLIIIGGHGIEYSNTVKYAKSLNCWRNITIIKSISNPMPILKRCDLFVLSSFYEGLPVVFFEAGSFNLPCISTDIKSVHAFMFEHNGFLVDDSEEGILYGFNAFQEGRIKPLYIDYEKYNNQCIKEFEELFS